jgi:hypothetical protein
MEPTYLNWFTSTDPNIMDSAGDTMKPTRLNYFSSKLYSRFFDYGFGFKLSSFDVSYAYHSSACNCTTSISSPATNIVILINV